MFLKSKDSKASDVSGSELEIQEEDSEGSRKQSPMHTRVNILKTIVGAAIFSVPRAISKTGFYFGIFLIIAIGAIFYWSNMTLVRAAEKAGTVTIQDLAKKCFGRVGLSLVNLNLVLLTWGGLIVFTILIGDIVPDLFRMAGLHNAMLGRRAVVTIISACVIFPISSLRTMDSLAKFSYAAIFAVVVCFLL
jgi:amino acid permease